MTPQAGCACQPPVASEQGYIQRFGESDVAGVVDGEVVAELPATGQQGPVGRSPERKAARSARASAARRRSAAPLFTCRRSTEVTSRR